MHSAQLLHYTAFSTLAAHGASALHDPIPSVEVALLGLVILAKSSLGTGLPAKLAQHVFDPSAAGASGVIAVVIYGLYGSANSKWNMSSSVTESPAFDTFWDTISFMLNGIVFFYAGASSVNFFWRSSEVPPSFPPALLPVLSCKSRKSRPESSPNRSYLYRGMKQDPTEMRH